MYASSHATNTSIKVFRHAVSLDERSVKLKPMLYQRIDNTDYDRKMPEEAVIEKRARLWADLGTATIFDKLGKRKRKGPGIARKEI